jgi:hypothetical protein
MTPHELDRLIASGPQPAVPADKLKQIESAVVADLKPVRPLAPARVYLAAFAGIFIAACALSWRYILGEHGWDALSNLQRSFVFAPLVAAAALLIFSVVRQMTPTGKYTRVTALWAAGVFLLMLLLMTVLFHPEPEAEFAYDAWVCFRAGMLFAIPAGALFWLLLWRSAALSPALTGATAGSLAGLAGLAVLEIHCPNLNVYHIVVAHISVPLVCALAGFVFSSVTFRRWTSNQ